VFGGDVEVAVVLSAVVDQLAAADELSVEALGGGAFDVLVGGTLYAIDVALAAERFFCECGFARSRGFVRGCTRASARSERSHPHHVSETVRNGFELEARRF
jgi:hypothetical protein